MLVKKTAMKAKRGWIHFTTILTIAVLSLGAAPPELSNSTPQEVFDGMRGSFRADMAKGVHAGYQWHLSGPNGGEWWITVNDGTFRMGRGTLPNPNVIFILKDRDWVALSNGTLGGTWAFLTGRLKIRGDKRLARKLGRIFP